MKLLYLASVGGAAMRRSLREAIAVAAPTFEVRLLAPDAEGKALRDLAVRTESWRPAGLFNVLRSINVLRRTVDRFEPDGIHAFGWTAAAVALGALPLRYASRTLVTLQDPVRKKEMPKGFVEKRVPELLGRAWRVECAYDTLRRVLIESLGVPAAKIAVVPYAVDATGDMSARARPPGRPGPIIGFAGRLESDRAWEVVLDALAQVRQRWSTASLSYRRTGPIEGLVRAHARANGVADAVTFLRDAPLATFFDGIDVLAVPGTFDGLPYALVEGLVAGIPIVGGNTGGIGDTLAPWAGYIVPDDAAGIAAGIEAAWVEIDVAWEAAQAQRAVLVAQVAPAVRHATLLNTYTQMTRKQL